MNKTNRQTGHTSPIDKPACNVAPIVTGGMPCFDQPPPLYKSTPIHNGVQGCLKIVCIMFLVIGCHKRVVQVFPDEGGSVRGPVLTIGAVEREGKDDAGSMVVENRVSPLVVEEELGPVYFDFDRAEVRNSEEGELRRWIGGLRDTDGVVLSGYCDERGSERYNMGLGQRRAVSVMWWMKLHGYKGMVRCVSYGKGRLVRVGCGDDEGCHEKNRRVEMRVE